MKAMLLKMAMPILKAELGKAFDDFREYIKSQETSQERKLLMNVLADKMEDVVFKRLTAAGRNG